MEEYEFKERLVIIKHLDLIAFAVFWAITNIALLIGVRFGISVFCAVYLISLIILEAPVLILCSLKGLVRADQNGVNIRILLFGKTISEQNYEYIDIKRTDCTVEEHKIKYRKYYEMVFVLLFAGKKKLRFSKRLKIRYDLEKKDPSAFNADISNEPMMQLNNFVGKNRAKAFYEKYPELL